MRRLPTVASQSQVPTAVEPVIPVALPSLEQVAAPYAEPAGRITRLDEEEPRGMSLLFKTLVFVAVVIGVFIIGKTFIFHG